MLRESMRNKIYRFAEFELDLAQGELRKADRKFKPPVRTQPPHDLSAPVKNVLSLSQIEMS
jgi:hypothetical protein